MKLKRKREFVPSVQGASKIDDPVQCVLASGLAMSAEDIDWEEIPSLCFLATSVGNTPPVSVGAFVTAITKTASDLLSYTSNVVDTLISPMVNVFDRDGYVMTISTSSKANDKSKWVSISPVFFSLYVFLENDTCYGIVDSMSNASARMAEKLCRAHCGLGKEKPWPWGTMSIWGSMVKAEPCKCYIDGVGMLRPDELEDVYIRFNCSQEQGIVNTIVFYDGHHNPEVPVYVVAVIFKDATKRNVTLSAEMSAASMAEDHLREHLGLSAKVRSYLK